MAAAGRLDAALPILADLHGQGWPAVDLREVRDTSREALTVLAERLTRHETLGRRLADARHELRNPELSPANANDLHIAEVRLRTAMNDLQPGLHEPVRLLEDLAAQAGRAIAQWDRLKRAADADTRVRRIVREADAAIAKAQSTAGTPDTGVLPTLRAINDLVEKHGPALLH